MSDRDGAPPSRRSELRDLLGRPRFRLLLGTRLVGQFGDGLFQAALATFVLFSPEREPDPLRVAAAFTVLLLPYSLIGPFAGVLLDRWHRRTVLVRANLLKALAVVPVMALVAAADDGVLLAIAVLAVLGVGRFVLAGLSASMPHVVSGRELVTANAIAPTAGTMLAAIGALGGVWVRELLGGGDGGSLALLVAAAIAYASAGAIAVRFGVRELGPHGDEPAGTLAGVARGLVSGIRVLRTHAIAGRAILALAAQRVVLGALTVGALLVLRNTLNAPTETERALGEFALVTGAAAIGALVGAFTTPVMSRRLGTRRWSVANLLVAGAIGVPVVLAGVLAPALPPLLAGAFLVALAGQALKVSADTLIQRHVPDDHLGRVFALVDMTVNVAIVTGTIAMAVVSPMSGQATVMYIAAGALLLLTGAWYARRPAD